LLSGLTEPIPAPVRYALFGLAIGALLLRRLGWLRFPVPQNARQIPQDVFAQHPTKAAARFGFELGTGVRTYLPSSLPYLGVLIILLLRPPYLGALAIGLGFGLARGLVPVAYEIRRRRAGP
jgi:hypothetical protein